MHLLRKVTSGAEKMAKMSAQTFKSQKYTFSNMLDTQVRILLEEDAEGMLQAAKEDLDTGIPVVGKRREEHARRIREQYRMIVETTRPFMEVSLLPEQFKTVNMRSPMVRLTVGICLPEGVLLIVMVKQKLTPSELAFTINSGYLRTPTAKKVRADSLEEAVISFGMPVGFAREVLLQEVTRSEELGLGPTPGATPRPSVPDVQAASRRTSQRPTDPAPSPADQEWNAMLQQAQTQRSAPKHGPGADSSSTADQEWEAFLQQQAQSQRSMRRPASGCNSGRPSSAADQEWAAMLQQQGRQPAQTPRSAADREWEALLKQQAPATPNAAPIAAPSTAACPQDEWDAFLQQELHKQRGSRMPQAEPAQVASAQSGVPGSGTDPRQFPTPSQPRRPCSAHHTSFARQPPPWQQGVNMAESQARAAASAPEAQTARHCHRSTGENPALNGQHGQHGQHGQQDPRHQSLPSRMPWQEVGTEPSSSPTLSPHTKWHRPSQPGPSQPWDWEARQRPPAATARPEPAEPPPLPAPAIPPPGPSPGVWPGTEPAEPAWPTACEARRPEPSGWHPRQSPSQASSSQAPVMGKTTGRPEDTSGHARPGAPPATAPAGAMPRGFIPVEGQVEFFSKSMQRYVPALLVGLAVEATSAGPPGSLCVAPAGCTQQVLHPASFRQTLRFPS